jgi:phosphohistidine phosphatase
MGVHELYLIRHGVAEERGPAWPDDTKRPLTADGISRLKKAAAGLRRFGVTFDLILTSPLTRTRQTADVIAAAIDPRPSIVSLESLAPDGSTAAVLADLEKHARRDAIAIVGHEPNIGELAARLVGSRHPIEFKKGAVCRIDFETLPPSGPGTLRWFLTPKLLRLLRR